MIHDFPDLAHQADYSFAQSVGVRIHREGHPGLLTPSVRRSGGESYAIFNPAVLSSPRQNCALTYRLEGARIVVEKMPGQTWLEIELNTL